jgi:hypothetical protein
MTVTIARDKKALRPVFERIVPLLKVWGTARPGRPRRVRAKHLA